MSVKVVARAIGAVPDKDVGAGICVCGYVRVCACVFVGACLLRCGIFESCLLYIYMHSMVLSKMQIRRHEPPGMHARSHKMPSRTHKHAHNHPHVMTTHRMYTICSKLTDALLAQ